VWLRPWVVTQTAEVRSPGIKLQVKYGGLVFLSSCAPPTSSPSHPSPCIVARITGVTPALHCCPLSSPPSPTLLEDHAPPFPPWGDFTCSSSSSSSSTGSSSSGGGGIVFTMSRDVLLAHSASLPQAALFWDKIVRNSFGGDSVGCWGVERRGKV